ncbi:hypothetical protein ACFQRB_19405 [Halobaculum litoreum]|uniref:CAAX protease self-immunity n=1 Tax=Halobaculum litoreum TaxID=3031998 RepID=A0ABD5XX02_9EURY
MAPTGGSFVAYVGSIVGASIVLTWLFNATRGSVVIAMLYHAANNSAHGFLTLGEGVQGVATLARATALDAKRLVLWVVVVALVLRYGPRTLATADAWTATRTGRASTAEAAD